MGLAATGWVDVDDSARRRHLCGRPAALWQIAVIAEAFERAVRARMGRGPMSELSLSQLCEACTDVTSLKASIALVTEEGRHQAALAVSDGAAAVEELQFTLGEGPGVDAQAEGRAVLVDDLTLHATHWVHFVPAARALGVRAAFAFPLSMGAIRVGVLSLYADRADPLSQGQLGELEILSGLVTDAVLAMQSGAQADELAWSLLNAADHRAVVHQATGMVAVQLGCSAPDALVRLRAKAFADGVPVDKVARQVVERRLRFER